MTIHSAELFRQNEAHKARQARLWGKPKAPAPVLAVIVEEPKKTLVQLDYHVWLYRMHRIRFPVWLSTSASFEVETRDEYVPYVTEIEFGPMQYIRKTMKQIALEVLEDFPGVTLEDLKGPRRNLMFVIPRHRAMYEIMKQRPDFSYPMVGRFFGRDHTVVLWAVAKIKAEMGDGASIFRVERKKERTDGYKLKAKQQSGE